MNDNADFLNKMLVAILNLQRYQTISVFKSDPTISRQIKTGVYEREVAFLDLLDFSHSRMFKAFREIDKPILTDL